MALELDQASGQPQHEPQLELQNERRHGRGIRIRIEVGQFGLNLKQLKSFKILKSALIIFTCNTKFILFMILPIIPLFFFMLFFDIKLQKVILAAPKKFLKGSPQRVIVIPLSNFSSIDHEIRSIDHESYDDFSVDNNQLDIFSEFLQLCVFWLVVYPLLETFSMIITMKFAAKVHAGEKQTTLKEVLCQKNNLNGLSITCLCVHLLSNLTLTGLFWILVNHCIFTQNFDLSSYFFKSSYFFNPIEHCLYMLSLAIHSVLFLALLYKHLDWSAFWNMCMVISVLGEETGIEAFGMADYYGKHCKETGFQLMLVVFAFGNLLRLSCLIAGLCKASVGGVLVAAVSIGLVCLGNLVKWIAFVLHFYDCKQQTLEKKADEEVGKPGNASNVC